MTTCIGVDFSGATDAGRAIWVSRLERQGEGLRVVSCQPASELAGGGIDRTRALAALRALIGQHPAAAFGVDAPFALPAPLMGNVSWERWLSRFRDQYPNAEVFRAACRAQSPTELRRGCDRLAKTPFGVYNLRLYRQTWSAIAELLAPLVERGLARVAPFQPPHEGRATMAEVCPASALKGLGCYLPYKGRTPERRANRARIIDTLVGRERLLLDGELRHRVLANDGGDAIDSVIAAAVTARAAATAFAPSLDPAGHWRVEGYVYW